MEKNHAPELQTLAIDIKQNYYVLRCDFQNSTWKYVIYSMAGYFLAPILTPCMIILSKILGREIRFGYIQED